MVKRFKLRDVLIIAATMIAVEFLHGLNFIRQIADQNVNENIIGKSEHETSLEMSYYTVNELRNIARKEENFLRRILSQKYKHPNTTKILTRYFTGATYTFPESLASTVPHKANYDMNNDDVVVFLHMQKTGGMYHNDRIRKDMMLPAGCEGCVDKKPCFCRNEKGKLWMYTEGFVDFPCSIHADWTMLHDCVPGYMDKLNNEQIDRRYFYYTFLRDPIDRYMSEWNHQKNVNHWEHNWCPRCGGKPAGWGAVRPCFITDKWLGVTLDEFMDCKFNLATDRMTRMLADLSLSDCYVKFHTDVMKEKRAKLWLESAKENLKSMEFFGIMGRYKESDRMFQNTYSLRFRSPPSLESTGSGKNRITKTQFLRLLQKTELDFHIYLFGEDVFDYRVKHNKH